MPLDGFLEIQRFGSPAVHGECRDETFARKKAMALNSFEFGSEGASASGTGELDEHGNKKPTVPGAPQAPPKPPADPMTSLYFKITKDVDLGTPDLFLAYCENHKGDAKPFNVARVSLRRSGGREPQVYLVVEFHDVFVTSFSIQGGSKDELPEETVEFNFKKMVRVEYEPQVPQGQGRVNRKEFKLGKRPK